MFPVDMGPVCAFFLVDVKAIDADVVEPSFDLPEFLDNLAGEAGGKSGGTRQRAADIIALPQVIDGEVPFPLIGAMEEAAR